MPPVPGGARNHGKVNFKARLQWSRWPVLTPFQVVGHWVSET